MQWMFDRSHVIGASAALFIVWILVILNRGRKQRAFYDTVPCPPHSPFWGHLKLVGQTIRECPPKFHYQQLMAYIGQKYNLPPVFYLDLWPASYPMMIVQDPNVANQITVTKSLPKHMVNHKFVGPLTGRSSVVINEGAEWKMIRSIINPSFSPSYIASLTPILSKHVGKYVDKLHKAAERGEIFELQDYHLSMTFDVIAEVTLGVDLDSQRSLNVLAYHYGKAAQNSNVSSGSLSPRKLLSDTLRWWHSRKESIIIADMIKQRWSSQSTDTAKSRAGIDLFLEAYRDERKLKSTSTNAYDDPYFMEIALSNVKSLLLGGHDTTSSSLSWLIALLSQNPSSLTKLRAEHTEILGHDLSHTTSLLSLNPSLLNNLPYTTACIKEAMRIFPTASTTRFSNPNDPTHPTHVSFNGAQLPISNQQIWILHYGIGQRADLFSSPHSFIPERHLPSPPPNLSYPKDAWRPFERGPRACAGMELAMNEMKLVLVEIARRFDFEVAYPADAPVAPEGFGGKMYQVMEFAAKPVGHMPVRVKLRQGEGAG